MGHRIELYNPIFTLALAGVFVAKTHPPTARNHKLPGGARFSMLEADPMKLTYY